METPWGMGETLWGGGPGPDLPPRRRRGWAVEKHGHVGGLQLPMDPHTESSARPPLVTPPLPLFPCLSSCCMNVQTTLVGSPKLKLGEDSTLNSHVPYCTVLRGPTPLVAKIGMGRRVEALECKEHRTKCRKQTSEQLQTCSSKVHSQAL